MLENQITVHFSTNESTPTDKVCEAYQSVILYENKLEGVILRTNELGHFIQNIIIISVLLYIEE